MVCAFAIFLATVLASAAGIGGGAVLVPIFTILGEFTEHEAIPLSIATVFGASAFSTIGNYVWQKHPHVPHRPVIAYDATIVLLPATLLGSTAGVFLNKVRAASAYDAHACRRLARVAAPHERPATSTHPARVQRSYMT